jgi:hypothetical protein
VLKEDVGRGEEKGAEKEVLAGEVKGIDEEGMP